MFDIALIGSFGAADAADHYLFHIAGIGVSPYITSMWIVMAFLILISFLATRNLQWRPTGLQNVVEMAFEALLDFLGGIMGKKAARKYFPFLATIFIFILFMNYSSVLPGSGTLPWLTTPTTTWSVTLALALCVFFSIHYYGIKEKGLGYFKHFIEPYPFFLPLNLLEEITKPLSLSLRLFGNMFGEKMVGMTLFGLVPLLLPLPAYFLGLLFGSIQAFVFTLLAAVYISTATSGGH